MQIGWVWLLNRGRVAARLVQREIPAGEIRRGLGKHAVDHRTGLVEPIETLGQRAKIDSIGLAFLLAPAGTDTNLQATARR